MEIKIKEELPLSIYWEDEHPEFVECFLVMSVKCEGCHEKDTCKMDARKLGGHQQTLKLMQIHRGMLDTDALIARINNEKTVYDLLVACSKLFVSRVYRTFGFDDVVAEHVDVPEELFSEMRQPSDKEA